MARALLNGIVQLMEILSCIVLFCMMVLTFVDVVGRYLLGAPIFGASEMISTLLAYVIFLGLGIANARDKHVVVELFDQSIRSFAPRLYDAIVQGFSVFAMCLIAYVLFDQAREAAHFDSRTIVLEWPLAWISGIVATLAILSIVTQVLGLFLRTPKQPFTHMEDV